MKGSSAAHSALVRAVLAELGTVAGVVIGVNASGRAAYIDERSGRSFRVPYGWPCPGGPDVLAAVAPLGRLVAFECKTGRARPSARQRAVHEALRAVGVVVRVVRSAEDARAAIEEVCASAKTISAAAPERARTLASTTQTEVT